MSLMPVLQLVIGKNTQSTRDFFAIVPNMCVLLAYFRPQESLWMHINAFKSTSTLNTFRILSKLDLYYKCRQYISLLVASCSLYSDITNKTDQKLTFFLSDTFSMTFHFRLTNCLKSQDNFLPVLFIHEVYVATKMISRRPLRRDYLFK